MASGLRDVSLTFGSRFLTMAFSLATQSCLAWFLGPADRGSFAVCILFSTLLSVFCVMGCDVAGQYFVAARKLTISEGVVCTFIYGMFGSVIAITAGLIVMQLPMSFLDKAAPEAFYLAMLLVPVALFQHTFVNMLTALKLFGWFAMFSVAVGAVQLGLTVLFIRVFGWGVHGALLVNLVNGLFGMAAVLVFLRIELGLHWVRPSWSQLVEMFLYGVRYYVGKISNQVNFQLGAVILALFATKEDVGLFTVAATLTIQAEMIPNSLGTVVLPRIASDRSGRPELVAQCVRVTAVVCALPLLALAAATEPVVRILFSPAFLPAVPLIRIMALGVLVRCACKLFVPYLAGTNRPGLASIAVAMGMGANLLLLWLLMPRIGLAGAAVAMTASNLASSLVLAFSFSRLSGLTPTDICRFTRTDWAILGETFGRARRVFSRGVV